MELDDIEIYEVIAVNSKIKQFIEWTINDRLRQIFSDGESNEGSLLDDYDRENGYIDECDNSNEIYNNYLDVINTIINISIKEYSNSLKESLEMELIDLLDYMQFILKEKERNKENEDYTDDV